MNCQTMDQLWDEARDQSLPQEQMADFNTHIQQCERCANLWRAESDWLNMIAQPDADTDPIAIQSDAFADRVVHQWQSAPSGVLAKIGPNVRVAVRVGLAVAAVCAMVVTAWILAVPEPVNPPAVVIDQNPDQPFTPVLDTPRSQNVGPVASLVGSIGQYTDSPAMIRKQISNTSEALSLDRALVMLGNEVAVPDPSEYVQP